MVYQNPANSLNPLLSNKILIKEPFEVLGLRFDENEMLTRIENTLSKLNLNMDILNRYPQQISGGEAQRLAIARVLLLEPKVIIFDEAVSSLDNQNQYDLLNNLMDLQKERILSYIYITHDLVLARSFCQKLIIMKDGEIVESGLTVDIFKNPKAEYTKKLLNAVF
jgi:ABC-type microcin C transport system duplicated ATPase subunit YejF